jgi:hypothetical protein
VRVDELAVVDDFSVDVFLVEFLAESYEFDSDVFACRRRGEKQEEMSGER